MLGSLLSEEGLQYKINKEEEGQETPASSVTSLEEPIASKKTNIFPKRQCINVLLILLTSFEVILIVRSQVYLHTGLLRSFLNFYADSNVYPDLFQGNAFYLNIRDLKELQDHINYITNTINQSKTQTIINMNFEKANMSLQVQYRTASETVQKQSIYPIDSSIGIVEPFDSTNITALQHFLLDTKYFQIVVDNLEIQNDGLYEKYVHKVIYHYERGNDIYVNYQFEISNALVSNIDIERPQANFLIYLRVFYFILLFLAFLSFYFNASYIRRVIKQFYTTLQENAKMVAIDPHLASENDFTKEEVKYIHNAIESNIQVRHITLNNLRWSNYFQIIQFDVIFSLISNIFQIIANFYLLFGREHQTIAGLGCLFAWMTVFSFFQRQKKLLLMYQLIKMSIFRVVQFLVSSIIGFMGYTFLGMCLFVKTGFFNSLSKAVTTLFSMMAGDSINAITFALTSKRSSFLVMLYIFSYVIFFMQAIHNTLISILKEYYLLKKIELLRQEKERRGEQDCIYIEETTLKNQQEVNKLRVKVSAKLQKQLLIQRKQHNFKTINQKIRSLFYTLQNTLAREKWEAFEFQYNHDPGYYHYLEERVLIIQQIIEHGSRHQRAGEN